MSYYIKNYAKNKISQIILPATFPNYQHSHAPAHSTPTLHFLPLHKVRQKRRKQNVNKS